MHAENEFNSKQGKADRSGASVHHSGVISVLMLIEPAIKLAFVMRNPYQTK